jgi:ABC-type multidrug transport system fused ATPase/permease subunit
MSQSEFAMERLEDQINWYDKRSAYNQKMFKGLKTITIVVSLLIPLFAAFAAYKGNIDGKLIALIAGIFGALITLLEAMQQLNQYHNNWITYRSTAETLKHEKYLYLSNAGPYAAAENAKALLAERVESSVSQEHAKWASSQEQTAKPHNPKG